MEVNKLCRKQIKGIQPMEINKMYNKQANGSEKK